MFWDDSMLCGAGDGAAPPATPTFRSYGTGTRTSGTAAFSVSAPAGIVDGDALYLYVCSAGSAGTANPATCSGFTQAAHFNNARGCWTVLKKVASGESGAYSVASTTNAIVGAFLLAYPGGAADVDVVAASLSNASSATSTAASITALTDGALLGAFSALSTSVTVNTPPSGMTQRVPLLSFTSGPQNMTLTLYELSPSPAGATGAKSLVWSSSTSVSSFLMQIK